MEFKEAVKKWYSCKKITINYVLSSIIAIIFGIICLLMLLRMMHRVLKIDSFVNIRIFEFAAIESAFLALIVILASIVLTFVVLLKPKDDPEDKKNEKEDKKEDKNENEKKSFLDRFNPFLNKLYSLYIRVKSFFNKVKSFVDKLATEPRKDNYFWQGGPSVFTYLILNLVRVLRGISVLQLCKVIYRKMHAKDIDEDSWRPNVPPLLQEIYYFIWAAFLLLQMTYSCLRCPLSYDLDVYFLIESTTWILYYGVFRRFFEEKYSIYHVMEHLPIIFFLIPLQAISYALICTYSGGGITWHELLPVLLGQASENYIFFSLLGFLYSVIVIGMILNSFPDEKIKPGNPNTIIVGAGDVVSKRLLPAMIHKKRQPVEDNKIGEIHIYSREQNEPLRGSLRFYEEKSEYYTERIPDKVESIYSLIKENFKDNNIVAWIETPSDTHLYYLRLLLDKADFIAIEKPAVSNKSDLLQLKDFISSESRKYTFFLSYYILEKALPLTFLKRPNSFYLDYLGGCKGDKKDEEDKKEVAEFFQSFLELGRIKKISIDIIEYSDKRELPPGGQLIETFIHHCLIASLFVGLPSTWKNIEYTLSKPGEKPVIYLSARGEQNEEISLYLEKDNPEKKQQAVLSFEKGIITADFDKKEATIIRNDPKAEEIRIGVSRQYKGPYEVQFDMVYRCYLNQMDPSNLDGLFHQIEVLEWLLNLDQRIK